MSNELKVMSRKRSLNATLTHHSSLITHHFFLVTIHSSLVNFVWSLPNTFEHERETASHEF
jgi:hypothetical protein